MEAEDRLDTLIKSLQKGEELNTSGKSQVERQPSQVGGGGGGVQQLPNNQAPVLPARPLPAEAYKNNLLKAKAEEDNRVDMKNSELSATNDLSSVYRKNPNIATGDSPPKEVGDKSSATFVSVGGDKLTLNLGSIAQPAETPTTANLIEVDNPPAAPTNLELLSSLSIDLPVSVTHFSSNGLAGVQRETLFSDLPINAEQCNTVSSSTTNPFTQNFVPPTTITTTSTNSQPSFLPTPTTSSSTSTSASTTNGHAQANTTNQQNNPFAGQKFATIGRSNPFSSPTKSKNPFLEPVVPPMTTTMQPQMTSTTDSPMSTNGSPTNSPEASIEPVVSSQAMLSKIETSFSSSQPVTRSLSSVGRKQPTSTSRLPVLATSLSKSNSLNNKMNNNGGEKQMLTNGTNSNLINNNETIK